MGAFRPMSMSRSFRKRSSVTTTGLPSGRASPSATVSHSFGCRAPCLRIAIELLLERIETDAAVGFQEPLIGIGPLLQIDVHDGLDGIRDLVDRESRSHDLADRRIVLGRAAEGDLVKFLALLIDTKDADIAGVVMAAGIDAAGDVEPELADLLQPPEIVEAALDA